MAWARGACMPVGSSKKISCEFTSTGHSASHINKFCLSITQRARGVARLTRLPVTEKTAGSNPVGPAE